MSKVVDEGPDYTTTPVFGILCWGYVPPLLWRPRRLRCEVEKRGNFKWVNANSFYVFDFPSSFSSSFSFSFSLFFILAFSDFSSGLFLFSFSDCNQPSTFVLIFLEGIHQGYSDMFVLVAM